jgi:hypothetical protein
LLDLVAHSAFLKSCQVFFEKLKLTLDFNESYCILTSK